VDLADIFSQSSGGSQTLSFNESTAQLTIAPNGNTVSLSALSGGAVAVGNYLPLSGGTIAGSVTITDTLSTTTLYATSAYMTIVDITQYELSGFNVTGDVTVNGTLSSSQIIYADSGNSNKWSSVYSTVNANSATTWNYQGADVKALTANWQGTYSTVNTNSAAWGIDNTTDAEVRALTANWQNTYTSFSTQSANNISTYTTVNANSASWGASTGVSYLSALNDVSIPAPVNGQVLTYNAILNKWTAGTPVSAAGATGYYGSFYDERNQNATSPTSAYTVAMSGTFESNGISLSSNNIIFQYAGTYEIIYSLQIENSHNAQEDVQVWFTKNGADIPNSNSVFTVHAKTGHITGKIVTVTPFITTVNNGDAIGIKWAAADTGVSIVSLPPNTTPTTPAAPGVIFTVKQVTNVQVPGSITSNYLPLSGGTLTGTVSTNSDIEITDSTKGIILRSPSNFKYRVTVSDAGELITTLV
jgi:hypothetical protein